MTIGFLSHIDINLYLFRLPVMAELARLGHTVYAIAPQGEYTEKFAESGITAVTYEIERGSLNPLKELQAIQHIYHAIKPLKLDILHTFTVKPNIYGTFAGKAAKVPKIFCSVTGLGSFYIDNTIKARVVRTLIEALYTQAFKFAEAVVFQNEDDRGYFASNNIVPTEKSCIIRGSGIDTTLWAKSGEKSGGGEVAVLMVARLLRHKGVLEFVEAARVLKPRYPNALFRYAGGEYAGNISGLNASYMHQTKEIEYLGERSDIKELMNDADIFVLPSYREGFPRTAIEAASMGLPIVTTDAPGCRETVVDGENGFLVAVGDAKALTEKIELLINDEILRKQMGQKSRQKAEKEFDIKEIVAEHLKLYGL